MLAYAAATCHASNATRYAPGWRRRSQRVTSGLLSTIHATDPGRALAACDRLGIYAKLFGWFDEITMPVTIRPEPGGFGRIATSILEDRDLHLYVTQDLADSNGRNGLRSIRCCTTVVASHIDCSNSRSVSHVSVIAPSTTVGDPGAALRRSRIGSAELPRGEESVRGALGGTFR